MPPKHPQPNHQQIEACAEIEIKLLRYLSKMNYDTLMKHELREGNFEYSVSKKSWDPANHDERLEMLLGYNEILNYSQWLRDKIIRSELEQYAYLLHDYESNPVFQGWSKQVEKTIATARQHTDPSMQGPGKYMVVTDDRGEPKRSFGQLVYANDGVGQGFFSGNPANSEQQPLIAKDKGCCRIL